MQKANSYVMKLLNIVVINRSSRKGTSFVLQKKKRKRKMKKPYYRLIILTIIGTAITYDS